MKHELKIFLVRHGETNWNAGNAVAENERQNLTFRAAEQIVDAAETLRAHAADTDAVYASVEPRALQTARIIIENGFSELPLIQTPLINERDYGMQQAAARPVAVGGNHMPFHYAGYDELPAPQKWLWKPFSDFESDEEIRIRFLEFVRAVQTSHYRSVIAATHGGLIRVALMHSGLIDHRDWKSFDIRNGAVFELKVGKNSIKSTILCNSLFKASAS